MKIIELQTMAETLAASLTEAVPGADNQRKVEHLARVVRNVAIQLASMTEKAKPKAKPKSKAKPKAKPKKAKAKKTK